jgi:hypothetical protein
MVHDCPQVTITANGTWYFRGTGFSEFPTTCTTTLTATFQSNLVSAGFATLAWRHRAEIVVLIRRSCDVSGGVCRVIPFRCVLPTREAADLSQER